MRDGGRMIGNRDAGNLRAPPHGDSFFTTLLWLDNRHWVGGGPGRNAREMTGDTLQNSIGLKVTRNNEDRIVGMIMFSIIRLLLGGGGPLHVLQPADNRISVGMHFV